MELNDGRSIHLHNRDETTIALRQGEQGRPTIAIFTRRQALALSDALQALARELSD